MSSLAQSAVAVLRGALRAVGDPRRLARLNVVSAEERERAFEQETRERLGGAPRTVAIERVIPLGEARLETFSFLDDTSTVLDLILLRGLVERHANARYLEIGTFRGESALAAADGGAEVVTVSLPDDRLSAAGADPSWIAAHRALSEGHPRIRHILADSHTMPLDEYRGWADVLFIDGDHSRDAVERDTRRFWSVRAPEAGVVVWHDAFWSPLKPRWEVIAGITAGLSDTDRGNLVHVSNTLCIAWLPNASDLPTVAASYIPRLTFSVTVGLNAANGDGELTQSNARDALVPEGSV